MLDKRVTSEGLFGRYAVFIGSNDANVPGIRWIDEKRKINEYFSSLIT